MRVLIDGDTCAFAPAASAEDTEEQYAIARTNSMVEDILLATEASSYEIWLTGPNNFRNLVYPEYKANRIGAWRPRHEKACRAFLVEEWGADISDGCEADDMVGVKQTDNTIIAHIDKDIDMIPGWHYNWELTRKGTIVRPAKKYYISPEEALRNFCYQLIVGDTVDNIKGVQGLGPAKAKKFLDSTRPEDWLDGIRAMYGSEEEFEMNATCLYIWRKPNDTWRTLTETAISESKGPELSESSERLAT